MASHSTFSLWPQTTPLKVGNKTGAGPCGDSSVTLSGEVSSLQRCPETLKSRACWRAETLSVIHGFLHFKDEETDTIQRQSDSGAGSLPFISHLGKWS